MGVYIIVSMMHGHTNIVFEKYVKRLPRKKTDQLCLKHVDRKQTATALLKTVKRLENTTNILV